MLKKVHLVPIIFGLWFPVTFLITYIVAVKTDHVKPIFPYISDTGGWAPESCIFGMMLTIGGMLMVLTVYTRYRQVRDLTEKNDFGALTRKLNTTCLYIGVLSTTGCLIVANFQITNALIVHIIGASLCFGLGTVFQVIQVIISFRMHPAFGSKAVNVIRVVLALVSVLGLGICNVAGLIAYLKYDGADMTKWKKEEKGYVPHVISAISEYILAFSNIFFIVTFYGEFKMVQFEEPVLVVPIKK